MVSTNWRLLFAKLNKNHQMFVKITLIINFKWKISAHAIGVGGIAGAILGISYRLNIDLQFILFIQHMNLYMMVF